MTNKEISMIYEGLQSLREDATLRFPARTSFIIVRNLRLIQPIVDSIVETRNLILVKLGMSNPLNPGEYTIPPENRESFIKQMEELDQVDNDLTLYKIKCSDIESLNLPINVMDALFPMIEEES